MICWHKYDKWSKLITTFDGVWQYRTCQKCGKIVKRKAGLYVHFDLDLWNKKDEQENINDLSSL